MTNINSPTDARAVSPAFVAPPGPRFPGLFRMRDSVPGPAFTKEQLDKAAAFLPDGTMTHPFILSVGDAEWYVFFRDPNDPCKAKRNVYQWIKAPNADAARLLLDHAPRPARNKSDKSEGGKSNA